MDGIVQRWLTY